VLFQSSVHGKIEDCGCKKHPLGGLAARAGLIGTLHEDNQPVLLVDAGNLFGTADGIREQSRFLAKESAAMGYHVVGVGPWDLNYGIDFLRDVETSTGLVFTSANLARGSAPLFPPYQVVEKGDIRVGLISVCSGDIPASDSMAEESTLEIEAPAQALQRYLPELRAKSDVVILLSNLELGGTEALLRELPERAVDFAIEGNAGVRYERPKQVGSTPILAANGQGKYLGQLDFTLAGGELRDVHTALHEVDPKGPRPKDVAARVAEFQERAKKLARR
jgi:5'-nucleotidase/UDP-sugar diphosphatase